MPDFDLKFYIEQSQARLKSILDMEKRLGLEVSQSQAQLWKLLSSEWMAKLQTDDAGNLIYNPHNITILNQLDNTWKDFDKTFHNSVIKGYANDLLKVTNLSGDYFKAMDLGTDARVLKAMGEVRGLLENQLGVKFGRNNYMSYLKPGGYLDKLAISQEVRTEIRNLTLAQIAANASYQDYVKKMNELIQGGEGINGVMVRYFKTYAYDTFSAVQASTDLYMANSLGLNYFVYAGTIIKTTREFCEERVGQAFSREEAEAWEELDWRGKNWDSSFFIARGGYNCRHMLDWISDEMAKSE